MTVPVREFNPLEEVPRTWRRGRRLDLVVGIVLGFVLGLVVIWAFVFWGSEGAVDAPRLSGAAAVRPVAPAPAAKAGSAKEGGR